MDPGAPGIPGPVPAPEFPPSPVSLPAGEIHVWIADLDRLPEPDASSPGKLLDPQEQERVGRLLSERDKRRFRGSRVLLKRILAGYLGDAPQTLRLAAGAEGKPHLIDPAGRPRCDLRFNLSHTGAVWVLAVRRDAEVGVDVERTTRRADVDGVAQRIFHPGERAVLGRLPAGEAKFAFFRVWSTREALVKCMGAGMFSLDLEFEIEADPRRPLAVRPADSRAAEALPAWVGEIPLPPGHGGVLATRVAPLRVRAWSLVPETTKP